jgi:septal ring factor EnvC (AmiA/AmiB activator)
MGRETRLAPAARARVRAAAVVAALCCLAAPARAQQQTEAKLRTQRDELERIRRERAALEQRMSDLQSSMHNLSEEVVNLDRQADATSRVVRSLDAQLSSINEEVGEATADLVRAEDELVVKRAVLRRRVADIYRRGPLYSLEVVLSAESFGALVARYKYLHLLALRDRALVHRVEELRDQVGRQRALLVRLQSEIEENRTEKADEEQRLRALEQQRAASLAQTRRSAREVEQRLAAIERDEARLTSVIAALEDARRRAEAASPGAEPSRSSVATSDARRLDWPVSGPLLYRFGRVVNPNNTTTRWNGIGIGAPAGAPVRAVSSGQVVVAQPFGTYGLTVIIQHGGGDYSVYGSLSRVDVEKGAIVSRGQTIGAVGTADPDLPPHLHFEMRPRGRAVDPLDWLREAQ